MMFGSTSRAQLIESATDDIGTFRAVLSSGSVDIANDIVRGGSSSFRHQVDGHPRRSEIDDNSWHAYEKGEYWYGFSYYLPASSFGSGDFLQYMSQFRFSNIPQGGSRVPNCLSAPCGGGYFGGSGCHLLIKNGQWHFSLQRADPNCASCRGLVEENFDLIPFQTDIWTDVVIQANWSHQTDGFIRIWLKFGDGTYQQVLNHNGITWFDTYAQDSDRSGVPVSAPNFTVGLYYGSDKASRTAYSDEIRVWKGPDGFDEVSPTQSAVSREAFAVTPNNNQDNVVLDVDLSWDTFEPATSYDVYFGTSNDPSFVGNFSSNTHSLPALSKGTTYYWRIDAYYGTEKVPGDVWQFTTIPPPNPCDGPVPTDVYASQDDGNIALNAMDCDFDTRWSAIGDGATLTFVFDAVQTVGGAKIAWHSGDERSAFFDIQISDDGSDWTDVLTGQSSSGTSQAFEEFNFPSPQTAKYVRYVGRGNSSSEWNSVKEVAIMSTGGPSCTVGASCNDGNPSTENDAFDGDCNCVGTPVGNEDCSDYTGSIISDVIPWCCNRTSDKAFDGDLSTFVDSEAQVGAHVGIDFGDVQDVRQITYASRPGFPERMVGCKFQGSNTGADWSDVHIITEEPQDNTLVGVAVDASYRYMRFLGSANESHCNIAELEFCGPDGTIVSGVEGSHSGSQPQFAANPNPLHDQVHLSVPSGHVAIYNVIGRLVFERTCDSECRIELSTSHWIAGLYVARYTSPEGIVRTLRLKKQ